MRILLLLPVFLISTSCSLFGINSEEGPEYQIQYGDHNFEIREYSSYIVAQTKVKGSFKESQNSAFRILAGYIFGKNKSKTKISMTSPVIQEKSQNIAMTSPVIHQKEGDFYTMSFMMPSEYKMEDLPAPLDDRITFRLMPSRVIAALRYTWWSNEERTRKKSVELVSLLEENGAYAIMGQPFYAGYNPPWTLPFLRRNEVMVEVYKN